MEEEKKKSRFGLGVLCGIAAGTLLTLFAGSTYLTVGGFTKTQAEHKEVDNKIDELQRCIDHYFLFDYEDEKVKTGIYNGMVEGLGDPYTEYFPKEELKSFLESSDGLYSGIGASLLQEVGTGMVVIVQTFEGSPSAEAGLLPGDRIIEVDGENVIDMDLSLVVLRLKGEENTTVHVKVLRDKEEIEVDLTRRKIEIPTVASKVLEDQIGYIAISEFSAITLTQFLNALDELKAEGIKDLIIDLRNNGGGVVDETCRILDALLPEGLIVYTEDKEGKREEMRSDAEHYFDGRIAVLVNGYTASASEIFTGAIKDYEMGPVIGTQTYGKGVVQALIPLSGGDALKVTTSRYFTPKGNNIHKVGITPDIVLEYDAEAGTDNQLEKAIEVLKEDSKEADE